MKLLMNVITTILLLIPVAIGADEVQIKPLDPDDVIALRVAGESLKQAQEKYNLLVEKLKDKVLYERHLDHSGSIYFFKPNYEDKEWKVTSDYRAFVLVTKESDMKKTCIIGIGNYK